MEGSSSSSGSGANLILASLEEASMEYALRFDFKTCNNEAKYEVFTIEPKLAKEVRVIQLKVNSDS